jgi:CheY-like chemotaxis protein
VIPASVGRGHVLLVEDNPLNQLVTLGILSRLGYRAEVVDNGREAVEAVARGSFGAVLMDCQLPGIDGYQATAEIRRSEGDARHTPIIALTASAGEDRARALAAGMDDHLTKPVLVADLEAVLSRWLPGEAPTATDPTGTADPNPRLAELFWQTAPADLARLRVAVEAGDAAEVDRAAHHLKGAALTVGLGRVVELCRRLELLGGAGAFATAPAVLAELERELAR